MSEKPREELGWQIRALTLNHTQTLGSAALLFVVKRQVCHLGGMQSTPEQCRHIKNVFQCIRKIESSHPLEA